MKRKHLLGIGLLSAAMLLTGCSAEILDGHSGQVPIYLTASVQEGGAQGVTRAGTDVQSTQLPNGEEFYGYFPSGATVSSATFTADGSGGTTANPQPYFTFSGTEATVHAYHGKSGGTDQVTNETTSFSVATDQSSDAAYRASDLMYATATVTKSGLSATGELTFSHKMAKIIVNATMGSGITSITAVKIVGGSKTINIATPLSCTLGSTLSGDNSSTNITVFSGSHTSGTLSCAALIPPQRVPASGSTATNFLQIVTNAGTVTYSLNGKQFDSNNVYTFNVTLTASQAGTTVAITDWADNGDAEVKVGGGGLQFVDLGLSVLWANMNVGATCETDEGLYFAWGDTAGRGGVLGASYRQWLGWEEIVADGYSYDWNNYKWTTDGGNSFTKYTGSDYTELQRGDDAAYVHWGDSWRMPTKAEMEELSNTDNCNWEHKGNYNGSGIDGYLVTSKKIGYTSNSIFLPECSYREENRSESYKALYWSSSLCEDNVKRAYSMKLNSNGGEMEKNDRKLGLPVRPVIRPILASALNTDALSGQFTINGSGTKVVFAKGNLTAVYDGSSWSWGFRENQWDYVGNSMANNLLDEDGLKAGAFGPVDLFCWVPSSSEWVNDVNAGMKKYGIIDAWRTDGTFGNSINDNLNDWGTLIGSGWRTLTTANDNTGEWYYLLKTRSASTVNGTANARYAMGMVNGVYGMILFPDTYTHPAGVTAPTRINQNWQFEEANIYSASDWSKMESAGCVFLPAAGSRYHPKIEKVGLEGCYWSSSPSAENVEDAYVVKFGSGLDTAWSWGRDTGKSVRLVRQVP